MDGWLKALNIDSRRDGEVWTPVGSPTTVIPVIYVRTVKL